MSFNLQSLQSSPRILLEVELKPVAGVRFQPTGFPDLGAARYEAPDGTAMLLVESAQSMANRLEAVCWDEAAGEIDPTLKGLPYVRVTLTPLDGETTCSLLEFHRLNSPYIMSGITSDNRTFAEVLKPELGIRTVAPKKTKAAAKSQDDQQTDEKEKDDVAGVVNLRKLASVCFKYDPNSLVHGVFLEKIAGRLRHPRALSSFIEASGVGAADSGGVKFDRVLPKPQVAGVDAKGGFGNVPFHRTEFTAKLIAAYFSLDLAQIRGYGLPDDATQLLIALSLWKVRQFLNSPMRLRSACELELPNGEQSIRVKQPAGFVLPDTDTLAASVKQAIAACRKASLFADPSVTELTWKGKE
jgi:CRISPR-associated protein Csb1